MGSAAAIRVEVESKLAQRVPAALTLKIKQAPEVFPTGIADVDAMLGGGIPRSSITELSGAASTGKTSFALSVLAEVTQLGNACAWVDVTDTLSPESAAAAGVELRQLLWLRMSAERKQNRAESRMNQALAATDRLLQTGGFGVIVLDMSDVVPQQLNKMISLATWYRFRLAAEHARSALIVLSQAPCAGSCAALSLRCEPSLPLPFSEHGETPFFEGQRYQLARERNRNEGASFYQKKPAGRATWNAETQWTRCG